MLHMASAEFLFEISSWLGSVGAYRNGWLGFVSIGWLG
jgi:hypothetical protein